MFARLHPENLSRKPLLSWGLFLLAGMLLYLPAWKGGFQQDFHGWLQMYTDLSPPEILDREGANAPSLYHLTQAQLYFWTALFGTKQWLWFLLFGVLHATNGLLLFRLTAGIFRDFSTRRAATIAFLGTLLFLAHPSNSEAVVWKACYHYHIAMLCCLLILSWSRQYLLSGKVRYAWMSCLMLLILTTTLELWYVFPFMSLGFGIVYRRAGIIDATRLRGLILRIFLPMLLIFGAYLVAYHARYGMWIGRGAYSESGSRDFFGQFGRLWTYTAQFWLGARLWPGDMHRAVHRFANLTAGWTSAVLLTGAFLIFFWNRIRGKVGSSGPVLLFSVWALFGLAIILHFPPEDLWLIANDRHLYFTGAFQCFVLMLIVERIFRGNKTFPIVSTLIIAAAVANTAYYALCWRKATKIFYGIQYNYNWDNAPLVLLLNLPSNYRGIGIIHANDNEELGEHLRIFYHRKAKGRIVDVAEYNMQDDFNGAHVTTLDSMHYKVTLNQWGTWWMFNGLGLPERENEYYRLTLDAADPLSYNLELKKRLPGMVILYSEGEQWREVVR